VFEEAAETPAKLQRSFGRWFHFTPQ
jgi:hypothetical protein